MSRAVRVFRLLSGMLRFGEVHRTPKRHGCRRPKRRGRVAGVEPLEPRNLLAVWLVSPGESIQAAIDQAQGGDAVLVGPGTYRENLTISRSDIALRGCGPGQTILDGGRDVYQGQAGPVIRIYGAAGVEVAGFTITKGANPDDYSGGGIDIRDAAVTIHDNELVDNVAKVLGGAISVRGQAANAALIGNHIHHNYTDQRQWYPSAWGGYGSAIYVGGGASATIAENQIEYNSAWAAGAVFAGPLYALGPPGTLTIHNNLLRANSADFDPGIYVNAASAPTVISNNLIAGNYADYLSGAGIAVRNCRATIVNNTVVDTYAGATGSGIVISGPDARAELCNNIVAFNKSVGIDAPEATVCQFNDLFGQPTPLAGGVALGRGCILADPRFLDRPQGDYHLAADSPAIDSGSPDGRSRDSDGSRNDMGYTGGLLMDFTTQRFALPAALQEKLRSYLAATSRYFVDPLASNTLAGLSHSYYGTGLWQRWDEGLGRWVEESNLARGYGSHTNFNEITLGWLTAAIAHREGVLSAEPAWGQIQRGLQTLRGLQTSGDPQKYVDGTFHQWYETVVPAEADRDRGPEEIRCPENTNRQTSDDNGLGYLNLLTLKGLASDPTIAVPDREAIVETISQVMAGINLRRFYQDGQIVHYIENGQRSEKAWDREGAEGALILAAMFLSGQISIDEFYGIARSLENHPVDWTAWQGGAIHIDVPTYHSAMFIHQLRAVHGMPITSEEFAGVDYLQQSLLPVFQAHADYARHYGYYALGTQVMSQQLYGYPLFELPGGAQVQFPGNESNAMPVPGLTLARATGPHAFFGALARPRSMAPGDVDQLLWWAMKFEPEFFHGDGLGWEAVIPWTPEDTTYAWIGSDGVPRYSDWGRPHEALNTAYIAIGAYEALHPERPLASFSPARELMQQVARFFDSGKPVGQYILYNNSAFDGRDPDAGISDDAAIASDKFPLLPGQQASFENYSSYSRGINGIVMDIPRLANPAALRAADFQFKVGNDNSPGDWPAAPAAPAVAVRPIDALPGFTRVTLLWFDAAIVNQWLEVTIKVTENTGLAEPYVFYFGNAVAESGNNPVAPGADAIVNSADEAAARSNKTTATPEPISSRYDFNRDRRVNAADELIARNNYSLRGQELQFIDLSGGGHSGGLGLGQSDGGPAGGEAMPPAAEALAASATGWLTASASVVAGSAEPARVGLAVLVPPCDSRPSQPETPLTHDAVFAAAENPVASVDHWSSQWLWLSEFEPRAIRRPAAKRAAFAHEATDLLLAADEWSERLGVGHWRQ